MTGLSIRRATSTDLPALVGIFNHYVANGYVTFETRPALSRIV
jgi:phosphinothricin acetyltransferase